MIEIQKLSHRYQEREAVKNLSLEISKKEIFGLLGPNGSGKTTLFRILSTALEPTAGTVSIAGLEIGENLKKIRGKIGVVFQSPSLDTRLTVLENLIHQGHLYGLSGKALKERVRVMLAKLGLADRQKELVGKLSGGLKRRVELAKGLLHEPELLLLDEPSTGLDPGARMDLWKYLHQLRDEEGITVLLTTHLMEEAEQCDRVGIMHEGSLIQAGMPGELKKEVGQEVLLVNSRDNEHLKGLIENKFRVPVISTDGSLQIEHVDSTKLMTQIIKSFPGEVESVTFRKPTLEDVFIHFTGHRFWSEEEVLV